MCIRCGAMKNDSVREELESSLTSISGSLRPRTDELINPLPAPARTVDAVEPAPPALPHRPFTADLPAKLTSPTLAEFRTDGSQLPEWRLQLQNSVRQRIARDGGADPLGSEGPNAVSISHTPTNGANALKPQQSVFVAPDLEPGSTLSSAMKRIEESRRAYLPTERAREGIRVARDASKRFPFDVVQKRAEHSSSPIKPVEPALAARPKLVSSLRIEKRKYDTNKLVPIPEAAAMASSFSVPSADEQQPQPLKENWSERLEISGFEGPEGSIDGEALPDNDAENVFEEIDDLAPISMRFNAGLFDVIAGTFATAILLSPFFAFSENWFSIQASLLFVVAFAVVMFLYLTGSIAYFGQTIGMKIFSLELVDAEESAFPSIHQAAVSSSVYLLSLALGGLGFLPILFNEERRAAHDLVSGTILVRDI